MSQPPQAESYQIGLGQYRWRLWTASVAFAAWAGLILQFARVLARLGDPLLTLWRMLIFFTVISNLAVAIAFTLMLLGVQRMRNPRLLAGLALTMMLVGIVFELLLRGLNHHSDMLKVVNESIQHDLVPVLSVAAWIVLAEKGRMKARDPWLIALFPIGYLVYALIRGLLTDVYAYPFINPDKIGWTGVWTYVLAISAVFLLVGHGMVMLDGWLGRRTTPAAA